MAFRRQVARTCGLLALCVFAGSALYPGAAGAQTPRPAETIPAKKYADCMALARSDPKRAIGVAAQWERGGGDEAARHCTAIALLNSGEYEEAARRLESLAATGRKPDKFLKAELLVQAGQAWLIAGKGDAALAAQTRALELAGPRVELLIDRSITHASLGNYWEAIDDLNQVIDRSPTRFDALVLRATAWRRLKNLDLAQDDIARAVELAPDNVDALLERGNIRSLRGDTPGAVADWQRVISTDASSPAAAAARENLAKSK